MRGWYRVHFAYRGVEGTVHVRGVECKGTGIAGSSSGIDQPEPAL